MIKGFKVLAAEQYIVWDAGKPIQTAVIVEGGERVIRFCAAGRRTDGGARR
ncbi:hypothetical protein NST04_29015 [Paenibacillus sp. FSL H7-0756]|uniref:hypothetical protein n=1 Tax=Paenibacillus sp. FSL H7-0756 TaxID=2954738 RepID=UPI0030FA3EE3